MFERIKAPALATLILILTDDPVQKTPILYNPEVLTSLTVSFGKAAF